MQAFMLYMSGSGVQIFSMGTVFMLLSNPIKGVVGIQKGELRRLPSPLRLLSTSFFSISFSLETNTDTLLLS